MSWVGWLSRAWEKHRRRDEREWSIGERIIEGMRVVEPWEDNERILADRRNYDPHWGRFKCEAARQLTPHPFIECRYSIRPGHPSWDGAHAGWQYHGVKPAVWRKDMSNPICASCIVEDPFE